jgi:hypothetical protein
MQDFIKAKVLLHSQTICNVLGSLGLANLIVFALGAAQFVFYVVILILLSTHHAKTISTAMSFSDVLMVICGLVMIPVFSGCVLWPVLILKKTIHNMIYRDMEPFPYYQDVGWVQEWVVEQFCAWCRNEQLRITSSCIKNMPIELIFEINNYLEPKRTCPDSKKVRLKRFNGPKQLLRMYQFLAPEYIILIHRNRIWLVVCSKEILMIFVFLVGYLTLLRYIWLL